MDVERIVYMWDYGVYMNRLHHHFLPILGRFMRLLPLFIPSHSLPLLHRAMTERRARDDRETKKSTKSPSLLHNSKKSCNFAAEIGVL